MDILLIGEFSRLHNSLKEGLEALAIGLSSWDLTMALRTIL
jgi:hypothetical protein